MSAGHTAAAAAPVLVATLHDVAPRWLSEVRTLRAMLTRWGVARVTLLAVPHFHHGVRLVDDAATCAWLRERAAAGDEIALHGYHHVQDGAPESWRDRARARLWTAGEGECLRPAAPLPELLGRGRAELASLLPHPPAGFVAPAWLEPRGFAPVLAALGFAWHETSRFVEALAAPSSSSSSSASPAPSPRRIAVPAIGFATRSRLREALSLAWAQLLLTAAPRLSPLRLALHPADLGSPRVVATLEHLVRRAAPHYRAVTTSELLRAA